ncbi:PRC-barrel domain-containing protein [Candidatus Fermentibacteria bacterium]|nr:PRC-barrel domain-containing protein [Candidatus Fermentibacteria bacterium]
MNASEIMGKKVLDRDAMVVGKVADIDIDTSTWTVGYIVVKMGLFKKVVVGLDKIDQFGDEVVLRVSKDELK